VPAHILAEVTVTFGIGLTVTVAVAVLLQPFIVPVTVYVVVLVSTGVVTVAEDGNPPVQV
jgi:hypothetical protein